MTVSLPTIDLSTAGSGDPALLADQLDRACREYGFFYLVGHGIDPAPVASLMQSARQFFALPLAEKLRIHINQGGAAWRGYFPVGDELTSGVPDRKEGVYFGSELAASDVRVQRGVPLHGPNQFPAQPQLREAVLGYMAALSDLGQRLLALLAQGLGLDPRFFADRYTRDPTILFRIFNYPGTRAAPEPSWGVGEHTDYGLLTLLKQDAIGGLQVRHGADWLDIPDVPDSFVCNAGDMLERLTGGRYRSALHRVRNTSEQDRLSLAFFFDPDFDAPLEPIAGLPASGARPHTDVRWDEIDLHTSGRYGDYLLRKVAKVFPQLAGRVGSVAAGTGSELASGSERLDPIASDYLKRMRAAATRMGHLIDDLLALARATQGELNRTQVDLTSLSNAVQRLREANHERDAELVVRLRLPPPRRPLAELPDSTARALRDKLMRMGAEAEELMDRVMALPEPDRREFARALLGKLVTDASVLEAWYEEAERRWGEIERGEVETVPWDDVRKRVFGTP